MDFLYDIVPFKAFASIGSRIYFSAGRERELLILIANADCEVGSIFRLEWECCATLEDELVA